MSPGYFHVSAFILQQESYQANTISCHLTFPEKALKKNLTVGLILFQLLWHFGVKAVMLAHYYPLKSLSHLTGAQQIFYFSLTLLLITVQLFLC